MNTFERVVFYVALVATFALGSCLLATPHSTLVPPGPALAAPAPTTLTTSHQRQI